MKKVDTTGYVKIWRKSMHDEIFKNSRALHLFVYLLHEADFVEIDGVEKYVLTTTQSQIAHDLSTSKATVNKALKYLKNKNKINYCINHHETVIEVIDLSYVKF